MRSRTVAVLLACIGLIYVGCASGALKANKLERIEYEREAYGGIARPITPGSGQQLISIKFGPEIDGEKTFQANEVVLSDSHGANFDLLGAAPSDQLKHFRDFTREIEANRMVMTTGGTDGTDISIAEVGQIDGRPGFKLKGKKAFVTLVFSVPVDATAMKLKIGGAEPLAVSIN